MKYLLILLALGCGGQKEEREPYRQSEVTGRVYLYHSMLYGKPILDSVIYVGVKPDSVFLLK